MPPRKQAQPTKSEKGERLPTTPLYTDIRRQGKSAVYTHSVHHTHVGFMAGHTRGAVACHILPRAARVPLPTGS